jgi:hypothetical protein
MMPPVRKQKYQLKNAKVGPNSETQEQSSLKKSPSQQARQTSIASKTMLQERITYTHICFSGPK